MTRQMTSPFNKTYSRLPAIWASYPRILLWKRPPVTDVRDPPEFAASIRNVVLSGAKIAAYARVCGFTGEAPVPVTYAHVIAMPLHLAIFAKRSFPLRPMGLIHVSNVIETLAPLTPGARVDVDVVARNYRRLDAGLAFDMASELRANGSVAWRENCCFMARWPVPAASGGGRPPRPPKAPKDAQVLAESPVTLRTAWDYARVSSDYNPIHLHDGAARKFGLRGVIMHGMWSLAYSLAQAPLPVLAPGSRLDTEFLTPVQLPAKVTVKQWSEAGRMKRALCDVRTGRVHMYAHWDAA